MFSFIKEKLQKVYSAISQKLSSFFQKTVIDEQVLSELEALLLASDAGTKTTKLLIEKLKVSPVQNGSELYAVLHREMIMQLNAVSFEHQTPAEIILMIGINGSGKTTCSAKLAHYYKSLGKTVLLIAADTFRAAAVEQLTEWSKKIGVEIFSSNGHHKDPAAVIFAGCTYAVEKGFNIIIIDTAGRLQTKINLMQELAKMHRTILKIAPHKKLQTLLTLDGMLGQNSFEQAKLFHESTPVDGVILTKMDGTAKGVLFLQLLVN